MLYAKVLEIYFDWLCNEKGIAMTPDEMLKDNLRKVYESQPTDVERKRTHTNWLHEFINVHLVSMGQAQGSREVFSRRVEPISKVGALRHTDNVLACIRNY